MTDTQERGREKKAKPRLERVDLHKHPAQGTHPYAQVHRSQPPAGHAPWQPYAYVPMVLNTHAGGESGFMTGIHHATGPFAGVRPRGYARSDPRILEDVCDLLTAHGELDVREVDVHCRNAVIRLEGSVPDRRTRRLIEGVADGVTGVEDVVNHLDVRAQA